MADISVSAEQQRAVKEERGDAASIVTVRKTSLPSHSPSSVGDRSEASVPETEMATTTLDASFDGVVCLHAGDHDDDMTLRELRQRHEVV